MTTSPSFSSNELAEPIDEALIRSLQAFGCQVGPVLVFRIIGHNDASEWKVPNGYVDLCDQTTRTLYEIEFHVSKKYQNRKIEQYRMPGYEIIIVDCSKLPADVDEIREYLDQFIVPD